MSSQAGYRYCNACGADCGPGAWSCPACRDVLHQDESPTSHNVRREAEIGRLRALVTSPAAPAAALEAALFSANESDTEAVFAELAAVGAVAEADLLASWATIDPEVVRGAAEVFTSSHISSGGGFARYVLDAYDHHDAGWQASAFHKLVGYAGEQRYFDLMTANGHQVVEAATSNNPVWDFLVDGQQVNVKTWEQVSGLQHIAASHPSVTFAIPEDAIRSHADLVANITAIYGLDHEQLVRAVDHAIQTAQGVDALHALFHQIPIVTLAFVIYRQSRQVARGKDWQAAIEHGAVEVAGRTVGAVAGMKLGAAFGAYAGGHIGVIVCAPMGAIAGVVGGRSVSDALVSVPMRQAARALEKALTKYGTECGSGFAVVRQILINHLQRLGNAAAAASALATEARLSETWATWPSYEHVAAIVASEKASHALEVGQMQAEPLTSVVDRAQQGEADALAQWGVLMANSGGFGRESGGRLVTLAAIHSSSKRLSRERANLAHQRYRTRNST